VTLIRDAKAAAEVERDIIRAHQAHGEPSHIWRRTLHFGGHTIEQSYNFALCEARLRARAGLNDGMEAA
jgi:hypothetical protein